MKLTIELDREIDGRWIAEVPELSILLYGETREDVLRRAEEAACELTAAGLAAPPAPETRQKPE